MSFHIQSILYDPLEGFVHKYPEMTSPLLPPLFHPHPLALFSVPHHPACFVSFTSLAHFLSHPPFLFSTHYMSQTASIQSAMILNRMCKLVCADTPKSLVYRSLSHIYIYIYISLNIGWASPHGHDGKHISPSGGFREAVDAVCVNAVCVCCVCVFVSVCCVAYSLCCLCVCV